MKRLVAILAVILAALPAFGRTNESTAHADDLWMYEKLDSLADRYMSLICIEPVEIKQQECDFLLASIDDSLMQSHLAQRLYNNYRKSPFMGDEAVAIYLWDNWFESRIVNFESEGEYADAKVFARFNRQSLIGCTAPSLTLCRPCSGTTVIPRPGRSAILFFYDTDCAKCKLETKVLPTVLKGWKAKADFYAVYVGTDKEKWKKWRKEFKLGNCNLKVIHLWDPELESDFVQNYGVLSTPKLFIIKNDGTILGRRLEVENLPQLESSL